MILIILFTKWENNFTEGHKNCEATRLIYVWNIQTARFSLLLLTALTALYDIWRRMEKMAVVKENGMKRSEYSLFKIQTIPKLTTQRMSISETSLTLLFHK